MTDNNNSTDYLMNAPLKKYFFLFLSANRYLNVLSRHRRADTTLETYASSLRVLIRCIGQIKGEDASLEDLTENDIYDLIGIIPGKESTVKAKINILGGWMEFETGDNLPRRMKMLWNRDEPNRTFITKEQYDRILSFTRDDCERLIMTFGSHMGLRMHEIVSIEKEDIVGDVLTIYGKGHGRGKVVEKKIPKDLMRMIGAYIAGERKDVLNGREEGRLLLTNSRNHLKGRPISDSKIICMYRRLSDESGIHVTSHVMRRLYCTLLADEVGLRQDIDTLRRMMRHENVNTTLGCYLDADTVRIEEATSKLERVFDCL